MSGKEIIEIKLYMWPDILIAFSFFFVLFFLYFNYVYFIVMDKFNPLIKSTTQVWIG